MKRKTFSLVGLSLLSLSVLTGCGKVEQEITHSIDYNAIPEELILNYNEEGMNILKANYPDKMDMELALRNIGRVPSNMDFKNLNGKDLTLKNGKFSQLNGKKTIIEIVQAHCSYCKDNSVKLHNVLEDSKYDDINLVTIFLNSEEDNILKFYDEIGIEMHDNVIRDENNSVIEEFKLSITPSMIYLDENGKISYVKTGNANEENIKDDIATAFEKEAIYTKQK